MVKANPSLSFDDLLGLSIRREDSLFALIELSERKQAPASRLLSDLVGEAIHARKILSVIASDSAHAQSVAQKYLDEHGGAQ